MVGETGPFIGLNDYVVILGHVRNQEIESDDRNVENLEGSVRSRGMEAAAELGARPH